MTAKLEKLERQLSDVERRLRRVSRSKNGRGHRKSLLRQKNRLEGKIKELSVVPEKPNEGVERRRLQMTPNPGTKTKKERRPEMAKSKKGEKEEVIPLLNNTQKNLLRRIRRNLLGGKNPQSMEEAEAVAEVFRESYPRISLSGKAILDILPTLPKMEAPRGANPRSMKTKKRERCPHRYDRKELAFLRKFLREREGGNLTREEVELVTSRFNAEFEVNLSSSSIWAKLRSMKGRIGGRKRAGRPQRRCEALSLKSALVSSSSSGESLTGKDRSVPRFRPGSLSSPRAFRCSLTGSWSTTERSKNSTSWRRGISDARLFWGPGGKKVGAPQQQRKEVLMRLKKMALILESIKERMCEPTGFVRDRNEVLAIFDTLAKIARESLIQMMDVGGESSLELAVDKAVLVRFDFEVEKLRRETSLRWREFTNCQREGQCHW